MQYENCDDWYDGPISGWCVVNGQKCYYRFHDTKDGLYKDSRWCYLVFGRVVEAEKVEDWEYFDILGWTDFNEEETTSG